MAKVRAGDSATFQQLFDKHAEALRRYAQRFVRSREAAEDLVQDVFLRLWRIRDRVEVGASIQSYLYITTRARALNHLKRERNEERGRQRYAPPLMADAEPALPPEGESRVEADEITRAIERALDAMPPRQREVAALRLRHQLTTAEISKKLGISPRTVEVHIARATKTLRELLPKLLPNTPPSPGPPESPASP